MVVKRTNRRPVPEVTKERRDWLKSLQAGDLVHYCNGGYWDLYPILVITKTNSTTIFTRWQDDFTWKPNIAAMKRAVSSEQPLELLWSNEDGAGLSQWRTHNFLLPIEANSMSRWIQDDKESTIPHLYTPPNLDAFDALRFWLKQRQD